MIFFIGIDQKSGNKHYNRDTPGDFSQLRQLHIFLTLSESVGKWRSCRITPEAWPKLLLLSR